MFTYYQQSCYEGRICDVFVVECSSCNTSRIFHMTSKYLETSIRMQNINFWGDIVSLATSLMRCYKDMKIICEAYYGTKNTTIQQILQLLLSKCDRHANDQLFSTKKYCRWKYNLSKISLGLLVDYHPNSSMFM